MTCDNRVALSNSCQGKWPMRMPLTLNLLKIWPHGVLAPCMPLSVSYLNAGIKTYTGTVEALCRRTKGNSSLISGSVPTAKADPASASRTEDDEG
jgi:hypothetical protein